ncbi:MAG: AAA family ATPase, partial [Rhodopirellula sp. JB053]
MTALMTDTHSFESSALGGLLTDDTFWPAEPRSLNELGLSITFVESLLIKTVHQTGTISGRNVATRLGLPFR